MVRTAVQKGGGKMADAGSVMFNFQKQGIILVEPSVAEDQVRWHGRLRACRAVCGAPRSLQGIWYRQGSFWEQANLQQSSLEISLDCHTPGTLDDFSSTRLLSLLGRY